MVAILFGRVDAPEVLMLRDAVISLKPTSLQESVWLQSSTLLRRTGAAVTLLLPPSPNSASEHRELVPLTSPYTWPPLSSPFLASSSHNHSFQSPRCSPLGPSLSAMTRPRRRRLRLLLPAMRAAARAHRAGHSQRAPEVPPTSFVRVVPAVPLSPFLVLYKGLRLPLPLRLARWPSQHSSTSPTAALTAAATTAIPQNAKWAHGDSTNEGPSQPTCWLPAPSSSQISRAPPPSSAHQSRAPLHLLNSPACIPTNSLQRCSLASCIADGIPRSLFPIAESHSAAQVASQLLTMQSPG